MLNHFSIFSDETLVAFWNEASERFGATWRHDLQCELIRRGIVTSNDPRADTAAIVRRLTNDLAYHASEVERITREQLDVDAPGDYSIEADCAESYHAGRAEALSDAIALLLGRDVHLYSETF